MTEYTVHPGQPGGVPYDQETDWGFEGWSDASKNSQPDVPDVSPHPVAPNRGIRRYVGRIAFTVYMAALVAINVVHADNDTNPLKVSSIPGVLPQAVRADYNGVLAVNYQDEQDGTELSGTAVKIGNNLAITAGHVVLNDGQSIKSPICTSHPTGLFDTQGENTPVQGLIGKDGSANSYDNNGNPDYAFLRISSDPNFGALPSIPIASRPMHKGQKVFFINYQQIDEAGNFDRYPNVNDVPQSVYESGSYSTTAAELAGVVIGTFGSQYEVATGMKTYGPSQHSQSNLWPGSSGGAVINTSGQLEGISVATSDYTLSPGDVLGEDNVRLPMKGSQTFRVGDVQPITPGLVKSSETQLGPVDDVCNYQN